MQELLSKTWTPDEIVLISVTVGGILAASGLGAYHLMRTDYRDFIPIDYLPSEKKSKNSDDNAKKRIDKRGIKKEASRAINEFLSKMKAQGVDVTEIYKNLKNTSIVTVANAKCSYDPKTNLFYIDPENIRSSMLRSLLSCASTHIDSRNIASGFERTHFKPHAPEEEAYIIGFGLSEGYKDVLLDRYFDIDYTYPELAELAMSIEFIVGRAQMERYFFEGRLRELLDFINYHRYAEKIEHPAKRWLIGMDDIFSALYRNSHIKKLQLNKNYDLLLTETSKLVIYWASEIYNAKGEFFHKGDKQRALNNRNRTIEMLGHVNAMLVMRRRTFKKPGIKLPNAKEIEYYGNKILTNVPKNYLIRL